MIIPPRSNNPEKFGLDPWLEPYRGDLRRRKELLQRRLREIREVSHDLRSFANRHLTMGLHLVSGFWVLREWAPRALSMTLTGDFANWQLRPEYALHQIGFGIWEIKLPEKSLLPGQHYHLHTVFPGGEGDRLPVYARNVVQDENTKLFSAVVQAPRRYRFKYPIPPAPEAPLIYEAHVGMATEEPKVGTFREFTRDVLPRVKAGGYNTIQLMAVMGHPYYGSFGYHVANFFAVAGRFGTPDEFCELVDEAHHLGLRVIMDIVHSHAVRNQLEGPAAVDGSRSLYFLQDERGEHTAWDSLCFDYGNLETLRFLLSNCRYYLEEYHLDGFRFDGVTSMLYWHHGLNRVFSGYPDYFNMDVNEDALVYLALANRLIHQIRPDAVTVAEDVSGMPGVASRDAVGFDYRMAMGVSDLWFKLFDLPDETWNMFQLYGELTGHRRDEKVISYAECHDQAIVGGQTAIFRLADAEMYTNMNCGSKSLVIDRAMALHKMMRLATCAAAGHGYLNFMGNEFGHPEWIDFPREGNNWSYKYARRQWQLAENPFLRYRQLREFDRAMLKIAGSSGFYLTPVQVIRIDDEKKVLIFERNNYWFIFNFHPANSYTDYAFEARDGEYETILDSDAGEFGGFDLRQPGQHYFTLRRPSGGFLSLYLPSRTALVLKLR